MTHLNFYFDKIIVAYNGNLFIRALSLSVL